MTILWRPGVLPGGTGEAPVFDHFFGFPPSSICNVLFIRSKSRILRLALNHEDHRNQLCAFAIEIKS
jgi:hypothetical protein